MRETIYTIPVNDVFEPRCGCPVCRLTEMLEDRCLDYILGAAMMEPDVRISTNRQGFCPKHMEAMLVGKNRLSLSLMLETRLDYLKNLPAPKKNAKPQSDSCFVCSEIASARAGILDTALRLFGADSSFRALFEEQEYLCYPHYELLCAMAVERLPKKAQAPLLEAARRLVEKQLNRLRDELSQFSRLYDYRSTVGQPVSEEIKTAPARTVEFLSGSPR